MACQVSLVHHVFDLFLGDPLSSQPIIQISRLVYIRSVINNQSTTPWPLEDNMAKDVPKII